MRKELNRRLSLAVALTLAAGACQESPTAPRVENVWDGPASETHVRVSQRQVQAGDLVDVEIAYGRGLHESERLRARIDWNPDHFALISVSERGELLSANDVAGHAYLLDGGEGSVEVTFHALMDGPTEDAFQASGLLIGGESEGDDISH